MLSCNNAAEGGFGFGHSCGALRHYYGRESGLELCEDEDTLIEPGNVVSMDPMLKLPEGIAGAEGYRKHDILVIMEEGAENMARM